MVNTPRSKNNTQKGKIQEGQSASFAVINQIRTNMMNSNYWNNRLILWKTKTELPADSFLDKLYDAQYACLSSKEVEDRLEAGEGLCMLSKSKPQKSLRHCAVKKQINRRKRYRQQQKDLERSFAQEETSY